MQTNIPEELDISERLVTYTLDKVERYDSVAFVAMDGHGKHKPYNKTSDEMLNSRRNHILIYSLQLGHTTQEPTAIEQFWHQS